MSQPAPRVAFVGMTHLGINSAVAAAERGFQVLGWTPDPALALRLTAGDFPVVEPDLAALAARNTARLTFGSDPGELAACDLIYLAPDVPTDDAGASDLGEIEALYARVAAIARPDAIVVILSQVPPGFTRARQGLAGRLYYQVETLVFGRAIERALHPERFIVGCADPAKPLPPALSAFLGAFGCPILPMRFESAELAKISINCCLVASVTVANTLAELCEQIGADWSEIAPALRLDKRIGPHSYLAPGLGLAGGNLERDLATVMRFAEAHRTDASVVAAWQHNSRHRKAWAARALLQERPSGGHLALLGLAYKENTNSTKNSPALALVAQLSGWSVCAFDPVVKQPGHAGIDIATAMAGALANADALAVMTPWPEFRGLDAATCAAAMRGRLVLDPYRLLDAGAFLAAGFDYFTLGAPPRRAT